MKKAFAPLLALFVAIAAFFTVYLMLECGICYAFNQTYEEFTSSNSQPIAFILAAIGAIMGFYSTMETLCPE